MCVVTWMFRNDDDPCCRSKSHKLTYPSSPEVYDRNHMVEYLEPFRNVHENLYLWVWENVVNKTNSYLKNSPWCSNLHLSPIEPFFFYDMNVAKDDATPVEKKIWMILIVWCWRWRWRKNRFSPLLVRHIIFNIQTILSFHITSGWIVIKMMSFTSSEHIMNSNNNFSLILYMMRHTKVSTQTLNSTTS